MNVFIDMESVREQLVQELKAELKDEVIKELREQQLRTRSQQPGFVTLARWQSRDEDGDYAPDNEAPPNPWEST